MQCVILAGGLGTRMRAITGERPKALLPVGPKTFIDWQLQWLRRLGVTQAIMALGFGGDEIRSYIQENCSSELYPEVRCRFDGKEYLGTGGAIRNVADLLDDDFIVTYGDSFLFIRASELFQKHRASGQPITFSIFHNSGSGDASNVIFSEGRIVRYDKHRRSPEMDHIDYGMFALNKKYFLEQTSPGRFDVADFLSQACQAGRVTPFLAQKMFCEIGSPAGYQHFCELMQQAGYDLAKLESKLTQATRPGARVPRA